MAFFRQLLATVSFMYLKTLITWWQTSLGNSLQHSCYKFLNSNKFKANLIHAINFASLGPFSVTYLELYLARECATLPKTTCKKPWRTFPDGRKDSLISLIIRSWNWPSRDQFFFFLNWWIKPIVVPRPTPFQQSSGISGTQNHEKLMRLVNRIQVCSLSCPFSAGYLGGHKTFPRTSLVYLLICFLDWTNGISRHEAA